MRQTPTKGSVGRGVYVAPWMGRDGELILVAINRRGRLLAERAVKPGDNSVAIGDELWELVERDDPDRLSLVI